MLYQIKQEDKEAYDKEDVLESSEHIKKFKFMQPLRLHPDPQIKQYDPFKNDECDLPIEFYQVNILNTEMVYKGKKV